MTAGVFLGACSGGGAKSTASKNILRDNVGAEVQDLDPQVVTGIPEFRVLSALFEGLADLDPKTMQPVPAAAASWEISSDGTLYTFHLRPEGKWSNGEPLTAEDFVYTYRRILSPKLGAEYAYLLHALKNGKSYNEGKIADFGQVGVKALDSYTLQVTLEHPTPYFLSMQINQAWYPVNRKVVEQFGKLEERGTKWTRAENHVGNGAFKLAEWRPGEIIRVVRNPHYWGAKDVKMDGLDFTPVSNLQTEERMFRYGELHFTETLPLQKIDVYKKENPKVLQIGPYYATYYYRLNLTKPPFTDKRVRRAFALALDRESIAKNVLKAGERPAFAYVPPDEAGYTSTARLPYDVAEAKRLLAEAGFPDGKGLPPVEILYNTSEAHQTIAEAAQSLWKTNLGADVRLVNQDWKTYLNTLDTLDYQMARSGWVADVLDPITFLDCFLSYSGNNRTGYKNPEYDKLIDEIRAEADAKKRIALMQKAEAMLLDDAPFVPVYFYTTKYLKSEAVQGYVPNALDYRRWKDYSLAAK